MLLEFDHLFNIVAGIRKIRKEKNIPFKQSLDLIYEESNSVPLSEVLKKMCNLNQVKLLSDNLDNLFPFLVGIHKYYIPIVFKVDSQTEIKNINEKITYLNGFLNSIDKKLSNENFVKNAPKKVIEIEMKKKDDTVNKLQSLKEQLNSFNEST